MGCLLRVYRLIKLTFFPLCLVRCRVIHDRDISKVYSFNFNDIHVSNSCFTDACLHTLSTVISTGSKLCEIYTYIFFYTKPRVGMGPALPLQLASRVVIKTTCDAASGGTVGIVAALAFQCSCTCLNAFMFQTKWFVRYRYTVYNRSLHISRPVFSKQPRKDTPWLTCKGEVWEVFKWLIDWSELWLCSACFCSILRWPTVI